MTVENSLAGFLAALFGTPIGAISANPALDGASRLMAEGQLGQAQALLGNEPPDRPDQAALWSALHAFAATFRTGSSSPAPFLDQATRWSTTLDDPSLRWFIHSLRALGKEPTSETRNPLPMLVESVHGADPTSPTRFWTLHLMQSALIVMGAYDAAGQALAEAEENLPWQGFAYSWIDTMRARLLLYQQRPDQARQLLQALDLEQLNPLATANRNLLLACGQAAMNEPAAARVSLDRGLAFFDKTDFDHFLLEAQEATLTVLIAEGCVTEAAELALSIRDLPSARSRRSRFSEIACEALIEAGDYERAWQISHERFLQDPVADLRMLTELKLELTETRRQVRVTAEIEKTNRRLRVLESRASSVLAALAHGVRDPLTSIQLWLEVHDQEPDAVSSEPVDATLERLERLLDHIIWLTRVETFQPTRRSAFDFDLEAIVDACRDRLAHWCKVSGIQVTLQSNAPAHASSPTRMLGAWSTQDHGDTIVAAEPTAEKTASPRVAFAGEAGVPELDQGVHALVEGLLVFATSYACPNSVVSVEVDYEQANRVVLTVVDTGPPLLSNGESRMGVAPGLNTRRVARGDTTGDIALLVAEGVAARVGASIDIAQHGNKVVSTASFALTDHPLGAAGSGCPHRTVGLPM